jgi:hypothetical protein
VDSNASAEEWAAADVVERLIAALEPETWCSAVVTSNTSRDCLRDAELAMAMHSSVAFACGRANANVLLESANNKQTHISTQRRKDSPKISMKGSYR